MQRWKETQNQQRKATRPTKNRVIVTTPRARVLQVDEDVSKTDGAGWNSGIWIRLDVHMTR